MHYPYENMASQANNIAHQLVSNLTHMSVSSSWAGGAACVAQERVNDFNADAKAIIVHLVDVMKTSPLPNLR